MAAELVHTLYRKTRENKVRYSSARALQAPVLKNHVLGIMHQLDQGGSENPRSEARCIDCWEYKASQGIKALKQTQTTKASEENMDQVMRTW